MKKFPLEHLICTLRKMLDCGVSFVGRYFCMPAGSESH